MSEPVVPTLEGKVVLVTGASRGIGAATAKIFALAGARVVITHRDSPEGAAAVVGSLPGSGHRAVQASAVETPALEALAASISDTEDRLDVLVNNAATTRVIPHDDLVALDDDFFDTVFRTNVRGPFATVRACRALLEADGGGVVVNVSSLAAEMANGSNVAYCASKAALNNLTKSLARALAPLVRVLAVAPGLVDTQLTRDWAPDRRRHMLEHTPLARLTTPEDIARGVFAAATLLTASTGVVVPVDGGRPLG